MDNLIVSLEGSDARVIEERAVREGWSRDKVDEVFSWSLSRGCGHFLCFLLLWKVSIAFGVNFLGCVGRRMLMK